MARISRWAVAILLCCFVVEVFTGFAYRMNAMWKEPHLWGGHALSQGALAALILSVATLVQRAAGLRRWGLLWRALAPFLAVALAYHTAFTGYLGPWRNPDLSTENVVRFRFLHQFTEPVLLAALLVWWWFLFRRLDKLPERRTGVDE